MHSCLSPCGDELMTPNNIAKMSMLKGLDLIAVTDHNTARQLPAIEKVCREIGLQMLPGLELTTREEVHLLAYFETVEAATAFSDAIYPHLPSIENRPAYFGAQTVLDENDEPIDEERKLLISALDLSIEALSGMITDFGGLPVPAHINRGSNGLLNVLGFLPPSPRFPALEISKKLTMPAGLDDYIHLHASDAHRLEDIFEREEFLTLPECSAQGFFSYIRAGRNRG